MRFSFFFQICCFNNIGRHHGSRRSQEETRRWENPRIFLLKQHTIEEKKVNVSFCYLKIRINSQFRKHYFHFHTKFQNPYLKFLPHTLGPKFITAFLQKLQKVGYSIYLEFCVENFGMNSIYQQSKSFTQSTFYFSMQQQICYNLHFLKLDFRLPLLIYKCDKLEKCQRSFVHFIQNLFPIFTV